MKILIKYLRIPRVVSVWIFKTSLNPLIPLHFLHEREKSQIAIYPIYSRKSRGHSIHLCVTKYKWKNLTGVKSDSGNIWFWKVWLSPSKESLHLVHLFSSCLKFGYNICKGRSHQFWNIQIMLFFSFFWSLKPLKQLKAC